VEQELKIMAKVFNSISLYVQIVSKHGINVSHCLHPLVLKTTLDFIYPARKDVTIYYMHTTIVPRMSKWKGCITNTCGDLGKER
jgi:hypothetical protein